MIQILKTDEKSLHTLSETWTFEHRSRPWSKPIYFYTSIRNSLKIVLTFLACLIYFIEAIRKNLNYYCVLKKLLSKFSQYLLHYSQENFTSCIHILIIQWKILGKYSKLYRPEAKPHLFTNKTFLLDIVSSLLTKKLQRFGWLALLLKFRSFKTTSIDWILISTPPWGARGPFSNPIE